MAKARIEYEEDTTSRRYKLKRWYAHHHWDIKEAIKKFTLMLMFIPAAYLLGALLIIGLYTYPIVVGIIAAFVLACIAVVVLVND